MAVVRQLLNMYTLKCGGCIGMLALKHVSGSLSGLSLSTIFFLEWALDHVATRFPFSFFSCAPLSV